MAEEIKPEETKTEEKKETSSIDENKLWGILSYISLLCLIPLLTKKDNDFVYFHAKQGLVLFGAEIIVYIVSSILRASIWSWGVLSILNVVFTLLNLGLVVLAILGIVNVIQNQKKELPLIGKLAQSLKI
ncbi:MAG: hypothetical protein QG648_13 [Patescibacteria group bacterium]|nr:hypothetical protein [Patescibacteria group bacterium]